MGCRGRRPGGDSQVEELQPSTALLSSAEQSDSRGPSLLPRLECRHGAVIKSRYMVSVEGRSEGGARAKRGKSHVHPGGVGQATKVPRHHQLSAPAPVLRPHDAQETESNDRQPGQTLRFLERDSRRATFFSPRIRTDLHNGGSSSTMDGSHLQVAAKVTVDGRVRSSGPSFLIPNSLRYRSHIEA